MKNQEDRLKEYEEWNRKIIANIKDIIMALEFGGKVTFCSPQVRDIMGFEKARP